MSKSTNMLRTRRRDNNVKPNRRDSRSNRLDRKSSRGMLYENEELRLKTININAEIERGQYDIKKLKRENEMLKKEIWCLRDEYEKLDRLLKEKKIDFSSSSTTNSSSSSESESCSEESEEVETSQNLENVQKTNLRNIHDQFDHLSVVTEETSCENSEKNSQQNENSENLMWNYNEHDVIKPDQSYPVFQNVAQSRSQTLPNQIPSNFFSPIQTSKSFDDNHFNQAQETLYPEDFYAAPNLNGSTVEALQNHHYQNEQECNDPNCENNFLSKKIVRTNASNFYQNMILVPKSHKATEEAKTMQKKATDLIVKIDNQNFNGKSLTYSNTTPSTTFSNGGNLEELLHDIESISQRGNRDRLQGPPGEIFDPNFYPYDAQNSLGPENLDVIKENSERTHKSELNVVLMPKAMPLIGFDKYKNAQRSFESINSQNLDEMSASQQNLCLVPNEEDDRPNLPAILIENSPNVNHTDGAPEVNPFFFGNLKDNYVNSDYFNMRYNPENFCAKQEDQKKDSENNLKHSGSKTNLLDLRSSVSSENDENLKFQTSKLENQLLPSDANVTPQKSPKLSLRRKVSIHFKGKKEKEKEKEKEKNKKLPLETPEVKTCKTPLENKKHSLFDIRFGNDSSGKDKDGKDKDKTKNQEKMMKNVHQKTPSLESKKSTTETSNAEAKTPTSSDSNKNSGDKKHSSIMEIGKKDPSEKTKSRKSSSASPERSKHVHVKEEGASPKKHKKHKRTERTSSRARRPSLDALRPRERSYSVCTDRSNVLAGLGFGSSYLYDEYSDRDRTNSVSSCDTNNTQRKMSTISNVPMSGKVPWCGCWGNGCL